MIVILDYPLIYTIAIGVNTEGPYLLQYTYSD